MKKNIFVLYLWREQLDRKQVEWRGRIVRIPTGEVRFFRDSATLYQALLMMLPDDQDEEDAIQKEGPK
jgi:hypothetical protein